MVPLAPGVDSVTITTGAEFVDTAGDVRESGHYALGRQRQRETYGVTNQNGTPDLVAVVIDRRNGPRLRRSERPQLRSRAETSSRPQKPKWDKESQNRNISIPVYESNGTTVIGTFVIGDATGPNAVTVPLSSLHFRC